MFQISIMLVQISYVQNLDMNSVYGEDFHRILSFCLGEEFDIEVFNTSTRESFSLIYKTSEFSTTI